MGEKDCILCFCGGVVGCGLIAAWVCWIVYGALALDSSVEHAKGCGWMLWGSTLAGLVYVPIGALLGLCATGFGMFALCSPDEDMSTGSDFMDGCFSACMIVCLNIINATFIAVLYEGLWKETCIPDGDTLVIFSHVQFYTCVVVLALSTCVFGLAALKRCCS